MATSKRPRSIANGQVAADNYKDIFDAWLCASSGNIMQLVGPTVVSDLRGVLPSQVVRLVNLLDRFFAAGLLNCVVLPSKLETGIRQVFADRPERVGKGAGLDLFAHDVAEHIRHVFSMVRVIKMMEERPGAGGVKKCAAFQRRATTAETVVIHNLVGQVVLDDCSRASSPRGEAPASSQAVFGSIPSQLTAGILAGTTSRSK